MESPKYARIAAKLRKRIISGELPPGSALPSNQDLATDERAAKETIRRALDVLVVEGLIHGRSTAGMFVRDRRRHPVRIGDAPGFSPGFPSLADRMLESLAGPDRPLTQTVEVDLVRPPQDIAERLRIGTHPAVLRHRVRFAGGDPVNIADAYYPEHLATGTDIMLPQVIERGVASVLADIGHAPDRLVDEMYVRMPSREETLEISLPPGTPVIIQMITAYSSGETPVSCWVSVLRGDRHIIVSERRHVAVPSVRAVS